MQGKANQTRKLMPFLLNAEKAACDAAIADNVAASLFGGFILVRSYEPLDILQIPVPDDLWCAVINPHVIVLTKDAREILPKEISLAHSLTSKCKRWRNDGWFIAW
jgi:homoserine kinase